MANRKNPSLTLVLALLCVGAIAGCHDHSSPEYNVVGADVPSDTLTFAGSPVCRTCHQAIYESWEKTRHTKKLREASLATVVNDADNSGANDFVQGGAGAGFNVATSVPAGQTTFDDYTLSPGVAFPTLGWDGTDLLLRIGPNTYPVTYVLGGTGKWKQRYMVTIDNGEYISPVQYNEVTREYVPYHLENWYTMAGNTLTGYLYATASQTPVTQGRTRDSWQRRCVGCHITGLRDISVNAGGEYGDDIDDMLANAAGPRFSELTIGCEACHGPSARHVELGGGVGTANNPDDLAANRADEVCGNCHGRGTSTNAEGLGYPWAAGSLVDNGFRPGDVLADFYVNTGASSFWTDGAMTSKSHHQQWLDHKDSPHSRAGVTCWKCHAPHGSNIEGDLRMEPKELCLSCHDGQGNIDSQNLALHTRHSTVEAQSCNHCHFNLTAKSAVNYDVNSHTYRPIYPAETDDSGIPNSCAACHTDESTSELTSYLRTRFPDIKPVAYATAGPSGFGTGFELDGTRSFNPLGGPLTYEWTFKSGPPSFTADQLIAKTGGEALFVPSQPGVHVFMLVVTNEGGIRSNAAEVSVDVDAGITQTAPDLTQANYVRSFACSFCHQDTHQDWEVTRHTQKVRRPNEGYGVVFVDTNNDTINDWMQGPFDLALDPAPGQTAWDIADQAYGPGVSAPVIDFDGVDYTVTMGPNTYKVTWLLGGTGKWKQRYMATIGEGEYILPIQYNEVTNEWVQYQPENWYNVNILGGFDAYVYGAGDTPVSEGRTADSWQRRCTTCHVTGARDMTRNPVTLEYGKSIETMLTAVTGPRIADTGIGCEACHGPGSIHVSTPTLRGSIVNPAKLSALRDNEVCGSCHSRGDSVHSLDAGATRFGFPWGANAVGGYFIPGMDLSDFYVFKDEAGSNFWSDPFGHSRQHHQQWLDMRWSDHFTKGGLTCATCHSGHNDRISGQLVQEETSLCKSCHPSIVTGQGREANHSRHPDGVTSCSNCHNPLVAKSAVDADISAHSFQIIWPEATLDTGIRNSCNTRGCHSHPIQGLRAWDYDTDIPNDPQDDYAEHQQRLNWLFGDMRPYAEPRVVDNLPGHDGKSRRVVNGFTASPTVVVTLDGTRSYDPNGGNVIAWQWTILSAPTGSTATLSSRLAQKPSIEIEVPGTYVFSLTVQDAQATSEPETVTVEVN